MVVLGTGKDKRVSTEHCFFFLRGDGGGWMGTKVFMRKGEGWGGGLPGKNREYWGVSLKKRRRNLGVIL